MCRWICRHPYLYVALTMVPCFIALGLEGTTGLQLIAAMTVVRVVLTVPIQKQISNDTAIAILRDAEEHQGN